MFNTATLALSMWAASRAFFALGGVEPLAMGHAPVGSLVFPLGAMAAVYFAFNSGLMSIVIGLAVTREMAYVRN